jgi:hypothetical protein
MRRKEGVLDIAGADFGIGEYWTTGNIGSERTPLGKEEPSGANRRLIKEDTRVGFRNREY